MEAAFPALGGVPARVDAYFGRLFGADDPAIAAALADNQAHGLPPHDVSPLQGRFLGLLTQLIGAAHVLELGTLGGVSTIHVARALPAAGRVVSIELSPTHAAVAQANLERAGLAPRVELRVGHALGQLADLAAEIRAGARPLFDLVFLDADKPNNPAYVALVVPLLRVGGVLVADNVVRDGAIIDATSTDPNVRGIRAMSEAIATDLRLDATVLQTVGAKGYDGMLLARRRDAPERA